MPTSSAAFRVCCRLGGSCCSLKRHPAQQHSPDCSVAGSSAASCRTAKGGTHSRSCLQADSLLFNRGLLLNAAVQLLQGSAYDYYVFQVRYGIRGTAFAVRCSCVGMACWLW